MAEEAKVKFSETGSQQVVSAFRNVGREAGTSAKNVGQAGSAMKQFSGGMKNSAAGIGNMATAFAALSLSIVGTWRAYRDLTDAQLKIDKTNKKIHSQELAIKKLRDDINKDMKDNAKGSLNAAAAQAKLNVMTENYKKHQKDGKHTTAELKLEYLELQKAQQAGVGTTVELTDKQAKLKVMEEGLSNSKQQLTEDQEAYNDRQQDFYLSILPTALSGIGSLSLGFSGLKGILGGGTGGLIGMLGPVGLAIGGISLAIYAFQTNLFGLKDAVTSVIDWVKERFGLWKDTLEEVFGFIQKGDWTGAFERIKKAAVDFWNDLVKTVPFFGGVASLADKLSKGDWVGAFNQIRDAAVFFWTELKKAVPFFAGLETVITQISQGKWEDAFNTIKDAAIAFWNDTVLKIPFLGDLATYLRTKLELATATAKSQFNMMKDALTKPGGPLDLIQQGLAKLGAGDIVGGFSQIWTGLDKAIGIAITHINDWVKLNFGIDLHLLETQAMAVGNTILTKVKEGLTFVARTWIDPIITALLDPQLWITAFIALGGAFVAIGEAFWKSMVSSITASYISNPENSSKIAGGMWEGIVGWFKTNVPDATAAVEGIVQSFLDAVQSSNIAFQNLARGIWNAIVDALKASNLLTGALGGVLDKLKLEPLVEPKIDKPAWTIEKNTFQKETDPLVLKGEVDDKSLKTSLNTQLGKVFKRGAYPVPKIETSMDDKLAKAKLLELQHKINNTKATIKVSIQQQNMVTRFGNMAKATAQHKKTGMHETLSRDMVIQAHRGERVDINRKGESPDAGATGSSKGINVKVFIGNEEFKGYIHTTVNEDQGNSK